MMVDIRPKGLLRPPSRRASLVDLAYDAISEAIFNQVLEPGSRLRVEVVRSELGMSSTPVREALIRAASQGLVVQDTNRGFAVAPLVDAVSFHELYQTRRILELGALQAMRCGDAGMPENLRPIVARMRAMHLGTEYREFIEFTRADRELHHTLVSLCGNTLLERTWSGLHFHLHVGRLYSGVGVIDYSESVAEHAEIIDALEAGDHEALLSRAAAHIDKSEQRMAKLAG